MEIILIAIVWYIIGCASFVYWWTKDYDFETEDVIAALLIGVGGIACFFIGWFIHGGSLIKNPKVLFKKKDL